MHKRKVLILCTGNSCRSQIAEGLLRYFASEKVEVVSAGSEPAPEVNPLAVEIMKEIGIDITLHYPKHIREFLDQDFDYVITTCENARRACPVFPKKSTNIHWNIEDPVEVKGTKEERLKVFRKTRDLLYEKVREFLQKYIENS